MNAIPRLVPALFVLALAACGKDAPPASPAPPPPTPPAALDTPPPEYPEEIACDGIGGEAVLLVTIGPEGTIVASKLERSSGHATLDALAQESVKHWRFRPATAGGKPVKTQLRVPMRFTPPDPPPPQCLMLEDPLRRGQSGAG